MHCGGHHVFSRSRTPGVRQLPGPRFDRNGGVGGAPWGEALIYAAGALEVYSLASILRPLRSCRGRELILYSAPNARSCARLMLTACSNTNQRTPSVQGGVVSEPMNVQ